MLVGSLDSVIPATGLPRFAVITILKDI